MTTYPLSEPATIYRSAKPDASRDVAGRGSLADCVELLKGWSAADLAAVRIEMDDMDIEYGPAEVEELLEFLRQEAAG